MNVIADRFEIAIAAAIDKQAFVTSAKEMTEQLVSTVESGSVGPKEPFHPIDEIGFGGLNHQMEMIAHQAPGVNLPIRFSTRLTQSFQKQLTVFVIAEDVLAMIAAIHDVVNSALVLNSKLSGHRSRVHGSDLTCQY